LQSRELIPSDERLKECKSGEAISSEIANQGRLMKVNGHNPTKSDNIQTVFVTTMIQDFVSWKHEHNAA
jgi:hypothetical protein